MSSGMPDAEGRSTVTVLAVDQGTSATKAVLVDQAGLVRSTGSAALEQSNLRPGWAEQDAEEIWNSVRRAVAECLEQVASPQVGAIGLSTQRESLVLWSRADDKALGPVVGWQDTRGAEVCDRIRAEGHAEEVRARSGLPLDAMFSASKAAWLLDHHDPDRSRSRSGEFCLGTVDSWLLWRLTGKHLIEAGNASRTQLLDISELRWDPWLMELFDVPLESLPKIRASSGHFGRGSALHPDLTDVPVTAVLGDSHAALFGHAGWDTEVVKVTYGTGSSIMARTHARPGDSTSLARTVCWRAEETAYALEGNIRSSGATLSWLADLLGTSPRDLADQAAESSGGVTIVPAFAGLGAPWWDDRARAVVTGLSFSSGREHLARAALESIALQVDDVVGEMRRETPVHALLADGGPTDNPILMQLQADVSGLPVHRAAARYLSALGAAHMAGHARGVWSDDDLRAMPRERQTFNPRESIAARQTRRQAWHRAVAAARSNDHTNQLKGPEQHG